MSLMKKFSILNFLIFNLLFEIFLDQFKDYLSVKK